MNKDEKLLVEAYITIIEKTDHCKYAINGCECGECIECSEHKPSTNNEAQSSNTKTKKDKKKKKLKESFDLNSELSKFHETYQNIFNAF